MCLVVFSGVCVCVNDNFDFSMFFGDWLRVVVTCQLKF